MVVAEQKNTCTVRRKIVTVENIDKFDEFPVIRQFFPIKIFHLVSYLLLAIWLHPKYNYISRTPPNVVIFTATAQA